MEGGESAWGLPVLGEGRGVQREENFGALGGGGVWKGKMAIFGKKKKKKKKEG